MEVLAGLHGSKGSLLLAKWMRYAPVKRAGRAAYKLRQGNGESREPPPALAIDKSEVIHPRTFDWTDKYMIAEKTRPVLYCDGRNSGKIVGYRDLDSNAAMAWKRAAEGIWITRIMNIFTATWMDSSRIAYENVQIGPSLRKMAIRGRAARVGRF